MKVHKYGRSCGLGRGNEAFRDEDCRLDCRVVYSLVGDIDAVKFGLQVGHDLQAAFGRNFHAVRVEEWLRVYFQRRTG